jgi:type VI secretion system secreted protein Hcp
MAFPAFVKIQGTKQGAFKGGSPDPKWIGWSEVYGYDFLVQSPRDPATGQASGKRQHQPVKIIKRWDGSSPLEITYTDGGISATDDWED